MQQVHRFAIAVTTNNDMSNVVDDTAKLKPSRFTRIVLVLKKLTVRNKVPGISYHEHVTDVSVTKKNQ